ncbi:MAG TPA: MBL fold metallo-hydrolase [Caulobacteraceae bacterium]|jgi:glyoxylase-like metal-dependent hydrolase (beta-lactamase superfamily II)|nr:MBL fold metallo-hydrolase [Caulobacteraceae bacterium]
MRRTGVAIFIVALFAALSAQAAPATSARAVVAAASRAMGADRLNGVQMYGAAANFTVGQSTRAGGPWPRINLNDYSRAIDFARPATRATAVTWAGPVQGGRAARGDFNQVVGPANPAWAQQLEIWTTPWGFLKGAAQNDATVATQVAGGRRTQVVTWMTPQKSPSGRPYRVVGYIGPGNLVERVDTWVENPIFGDLRVERLYSGYRDAGGVMFPTSIVERRDGQTSFEAQIFGIVANPPDIAQLTAAPQGVAPQGPPPAYQGPTSQKLADGVWRINGAYNALAVEFADYILLFEPAPNNEARAQAVIAETKRVIPGKPIRYGVISHHHFDHAGGLSAVVAEGITIVTPAVNKAFLDRALSAPRTLAPDAIARSGKRPVVEGFVGDKRVFQDATRTFEVHVVKGLPHADGMVMGWLPKEKILISADLFNLASPPPDPPVVATQVFLANIERLGLDPERIVSVHTLVPDRLATMDDIRTLVGLPRPR